MLPEEITATEAHQLARGNAPDWIEEARRFVGTHDDGDGDVDHWQDGTGFNGPKPSREDSARDTYMEALEEVFVVEDLISEVIERRKNAVLGQPPEINVAPAEEEGSEDAEEEAEGLTPTEGVARLLSDWWEEEGLTDRWEELLTRVSSEEHALLRLVVSQSILDDGEPAGIESVEDALRGIRIELIERDQGLVHEDLRTKKETGVIAFQKVTEGGDEVDYTEKTYRREGGETALRIEYEGGTDLPEGVDRVQESTFDLGGNLMHYQVEDNLLISESVRSNQKTLNTTRTMINITGQKAGFPELHLVNVLSPEDEEGNPETPERGPGKIQYHVSVPKKAQGPGGQTEERAGTADVFETDPVDNESLREDADLARRSIYRSAQQLHVFLSDASASGVSRVQARHDHVSDVEDVAEKLDRAGVWALETAYALATELAGETGEDLLDPGEAEMEFSCNVDPGPVPPDEKTEIRKAQGAGFLSLRTALIKYGVDDPEEEIQRIRQEQEEQMVMRQAAQDEFAESVMRRRRELEGVSGQAGNRDSNQSDE